MKNIILGIIGSLLVLYTIVLALGMYNEYTRKNELDNSLAEVMKSVMEEYYIADEARDFLPVEDDAEENVRNMIREGLLQRLSEESDVEITISDCDMDKGLLAVCVKESFRMPNGRMRTVSCEKTLIADSAAKQNHLLTVRYLCGEELYKEYCVVRGQTLVEPKAPAGNFLGWHLEGTEDGSLYHFSDEKTVTSDLSFTAVYE